MKKNQPQVYIFDASAGSGKTFAIVKHYLKLLLTHENFPFATKDILAITFTNKSSIEMKTRIIELLKKFALDNFSPQEDVLKQSVISYLQLDKKNLQQKAKTAIDYILKNYDTVAIKTIDSFINLLISSCIFKLNLSPNFQIKQQYNDYLLFSLDNLIDKGKNNKTISRILKNFLHQYLTVENKKSWFVKDDIFNVIKLLFNCNNIYGSLFKKKEINKNNSIYKLKKKFILLCNQLSNCLPEGTNKNFVNALDNLKNQTAESLDTNNLSKYFDHPNFPINRGYNVPQEVMVLWENIRTTLKLLYETEATTSLNSYVDIFCYVLAELKSLIQKENIIFLEELNKYTKSLLKEENLPLSELYLRLAVRIKHYLIDEFQDTSLLQWENISPMVEEAISSGGTLFYVGDKKQAIYRFRGAEVKLFDNVKQIFKNRGIEISVNQLNINYRSKNVIVEFVNKIFSRENLESFISNLNDSIIKQEVFSIYENSQQQPKEKNLNGFVRVEFVTGNNKEEIEDIIKQKLLDLLKDLLQRFHENDIAILTRENQQVELLSNLLLEHGISVESEKTLNLRNNFLIKEIFSFLKFLNSPIDNLSFASFILSNMFIKSTNLSYETIQKFIFEFNTKRNSSYNQYLYKEFQEKFSDIWTQYIQDFLDNAVVLPVYELVINIIHKFNIMTNFYNYQGFVMGFLELIKNKEEDYPSLASFIEYFNSAEDTDLYINFPTGSSVKILTIHKAKGLEFPVVIIPFLDLNLTLGIGEKRAGQFIIQEDINTDSLYIIRLKKKYNFYSDELKNLYQQEFTRTFIDEINSIYVALTRAKDELYVFVPKKKNENNISSLFNFERKTEAVYEYGNKIYLKEKVEEKPKMITLTPTKYTNWSNMIKEEFGEYVSLSERKRVLEGEILHKILSYIGNLNNKDIHQEILSAMKKTQVFFPTIDVYKYESLIQNLLFNPELKKFFFVENGIVYQEKEIVDSLGNTKRVDRLIIKPNIVTVIDYKLSTSQENVIKYYSQLKEYIEILKNIFPDKPVEGYLIYLDTLTYEKFKQ